MVGMSGDSGELGKACPSFKLGTCQAGLIVCCYGGGYRSIMARAFHLFSKEARNPDF